MSIISRATEADLDDVVALNPMFTRPGEATELSRYSIPATESLPETAYQIVHDEAMLDGNARLNLATFVGTWMDDHARRLYAETFDKNMVDKDEYPAHRRRSRTRCWTMLADLWHAPDPRHTIGTSTIGSSEACMLGGLALKRRWQHARRAAGQAHRPAQPDHDPAPSRSAGRSSATTGTSRCGWCRSPTEHKVLDGHDLESYVDENTIGVVAILGVTYTGMYEPVEGDRRRAGPDPGDDRAGRPDPRRRGVRRVDRPVHPARPRMGLPGASGCARSARPATSTAWSTPGSAGWCGGTRRPCPRTWSSTSPTSAATCRRWR